MVITMDENEKYVRSRWLVVANDGTRRHPLLRLCGNIIRRCEGEWDEAWSAARAFTEQREREIDEVQEEVAWLTKESSQKALHAESRRSCVRNSENLSDEDRKIAHKLAEQISGRRMPKQSEKQEAQNNAAELRIAAKLDAETIILQRILAVEQARLAELRRGMKEGSE